VTPPQDPADEPAGDDLPDEVPDGVPDAIPDAVPDPVSAEDGLWRAIVANYGERPEIAEPEVELPPPSAHLAQFPGDPAPGDEFPGDEFPGDEDPGERPVPAELEDHYVPPVPPPLPKPPPLRLLAWVGLFGVPVFVLVALMAHLALPSWVGLLLMVWFVGGFVFLVASMRPGTGEDYDDGARL